MSTSFKRTLGATLVGLTFAAGAQADNPIIEERFSADPAENTPSITVIEL